MDIVHKKIFAPGPCSLGSLSRFLMPGDAPKGPLGCAGLGKQYSYSFIQGISFAYYIVMYRLKVVSRESSNVKRVYKGAWCE